MKSANKNKYLLLGAAVFGSFLAGCSAENEEGAQAEEVREIVVATGNAYQPFIYLDEDGNLTGYEKAVLDAVDEKLEDYSFTYESYDFKNILPALENGKAQLAAHQYAVNEERQEKYLFGETGYTKYSGYIAVDGDSENSFQSLKDLEGKKVIAAPASNFAYLLETYNEENENDIEIIYNSGNSEIVVNDLQSGTADATLLLEYNIDRINESFDANLVLTGEPVNGSETFFVFPKTETELQKAVDKALEELTAEGTLSELSIEYIGKDYTQ